MIIPAIQTQITVGVTLVGKLLYASTEHAVNRMVLGGMTIDVHVHRDGT